MFEKAKIEIYDLDSQSDIIVTSTFEGDGEEIWGGREE